MEKSKAFQTKVERVQHRQTSFTTNFKGTSLGRRHKRGEKPTQNKPKTIKKIVIRSCVLSHSVVSNSLWSCGLQPARLLCPWNFPGRNTGVGCHFLLQNRSVMSNSLQPHGLYSPWYSAGQNTGVGSLSLLQGIFPTQGSNPGPPHCGQTLFQLSHKGSNRIIHIDNYLNCKWITCTNPRT